MTWIAAAVIGGSVISSVVGAGASESAANTEAGAADQAAQVQQNMYNQTSANVAPWLKQGKTALSDLMNGVNNGSLTPTPYTPFSMQQFQSQQDPSYQFMLSQGQNALTNASSLSGGMGSNNLKGLINYTEGAASTDYQTALQNYIQQYQLGNNAKQQQFTNLQSISQGGMGAALQQGQIGTTTAANIGNDLTAAGSAQAAGTVGVANAITGGIGSGYTAYLQSQYMNPTTSAATYTPPTSSPYSNPYWAQ